MAIRLLSVVTGSAVATFAVVLYAISPAPEPSTVQPAPAPEVESRVVLPTVEEGASVKRIVPFKDYKIELDLKQQHLAISTPDEHSWRTAEEKFRKGDIVAVKGRTSKLRVGQQVLADLKDSQLLVVNEVRGEWVSAAVLANGQRKSGWVNSNELRFQGEEPRVDPIITRSGGSCVGTSLLAQKAKQFDDGLYAAVEYAAQRGLGKFGGKSELLSKLAAELTQSGNGKQGSAITTLLSAGRLGGHKNKFAQPFETDVNSNIASFQADELRSKPLGFYTWNNDLKNIFQQDQMLQTELKGGKQIAAVVDALKGDPQLSETYVGYLKLVSSLTNPLSKPDLRPFLEGGNSGKISMAEDGVHFFPPSRSHETDLIMRLYGNSPIPDGFNLSDELLKRIESGDVDLTPSPTSGWYDYQTWSLEPLAIPQKMPEGEQLTFDESYRKQLRELFKGVLALTRETHIKQLEIPAPASAAEPPGEPRPMVYISPEISVEPLPSVYLRRAISYGFIRGVLEEAFGPEALKEMHRLTAAGPVEQSLADELAQMESLFLGAYSTSMLQIGMDPSSQPTAGTNLNGHAANFLKWAANVDLDPDLGRDVRMMVPVFYDQDRKLTKVWAFLGWTAKEIHFSFEKTPTVTVRDKTGDRVGSDQGPEVNFHGTSHTLYYPVVAEIYVSRLLNREEFRRHCDVYQTKSVILKNLQ